MSNELVHVEGQMTQTQNGTVAVAQSRAMAETIASMQVAKQFPRNVVQSINRIKNACMRPNLAAVSTYTYARGGTDITGPSIRLAEVLAQNWGNIRCGITELEQRNGESTVKAWCVDDETNYRMEKEFQVKHIIWKRNGGAKQLVDPRDIYEKIANDGARRLRACILAVIPKDVVDDAVETCEQTLKANVNLTKDRIDAMLEKFAEYDVTPEMIAKRIQRENVYAITPAQFIDLGKKYNALKDGVAHVEDFFEKESETKKTEEGQTQKKDLKAALGISGNAENKSEETKKTVKKDKESAPETKGQTGDLFDDK